MADPRPLTRDQLAKFLPDQEAIRRFERLFAMVGDILPADIALLIKLSEEASIDANNAGSRAQSVADSLVEFAQDSSAAIAVIEARSQAVADQLSRIAQALEFIATQPVQKNDNSVSTDYIDLPEDGPHITQVRRVQWNRDDGTVDVGLYGGSVLQVGQETMYYAKNTSGAPIANGTPVMFTGAIGASGKLTFGLAVADGSVPSEYMMGVVTQDIADNAFGYVTSFGLVRGFNTTGAPYGEAWSDGDLLYFDPAAPGSWTNVKPVAPNIAVPVAVVVNAGGGGSGSIFVRMELSESLNNLQDVYINGGGPLAGQVLIYDQTQGRWENHHLTPGTNVSITNADGSVTISVSGAPPTGSAGGVLSGTYPNPGFAVDMATQAELDALASATSTALSGKEPTIAAGTTAQYWRGDKSWSDFATDVRAAVLTGLSTATNAVITATDTVLSALGKLQKQISDNLTTLTSHTGNTSNPHSVTKAQVGLGSVENTALSTWTGSTNVTTLGTVTTGVWNGTDVAVAAGGTGASDAATARTNLGAEASANKGVANGYAGLDASAFLPVAQSRLYYNTNAKSMSSASGNVDWFSIAFGAYQGKPAKISVVFGLASGSGGARIWYRSSIVVETGGATLSETNLNNNTGSNGSLSFVLSGATLIVRTTSSVGSAETARMSIMIEGYDMTSSSVTVL